MKVKINFKFYDFINWETNNYYKHIAQFPRKKRQSGNEIE